jgi:hypothetical protein
MSVEELAELLQTGFDEGPNRRERLDADEPEMLLAIAKYVHIDDGPEFAADDLRRLILELSMVTDAIRYAQDALQDRLPEAQRVQDAHEEAHPLSFPQQE